MPSLLHVGRVRLRILRGVDFIRSLLSALARRQTHNPVVKAHKHNLDPINKLDIFNIQNRM